MRKHKKKIISAVVLLVVILGIYITMQYAGITFPSIKQTQDWVQSFGILSPLVYMLIYTVATVTLAPATPLTVASGALFGFYLGTLYTVIGATIGAVMAFVIARKLGGGFLSNLKGGKLATIGKYEKKLEENAIGVMLFLRFVPLFPFNGLNFALGLTEVSLKDYIYTTFIGIIPGTAAYVFFGESLSTLNIWKIALAFLILTLLSVVAGKVTKVNK